MHFGTFHVEDDMGYRYEQVLTYEVARELLNSHIADCSAVIGDEREKDVPDLGRIEQMHQKMQALFNERERMDMTNDDAMRAVIAKYRREPIRRIMEAASD